MRFTKMHGIGNDYVYLDCVNGPVPHDPARLSQRISDRHFGIGSDGLILICPSDKAQVRMRMFNADGSESEMCGNGLRCVAKFAYDHNLARVSPMAIETGRGVLTVTLAVEKGKAEWITVDMGEPILQGLAIPTTFAMEKVVNVELPSELASRVKQLCEPAGLLPGVTCVSMGNPHVTLYCNDVKKVPLEVVGPILENASIFPKRINVHFVQVHSPGEVTMRTWERGSGITWACGTGACAVAVSGVLTGKTDRQLLAHLPGGDLKLEWKASDNHVLMTGPATEVFTGEWPD